MSLDEAQEFVQMILWQQWPILPPNVHRADLQQAGLVGWWQAEQSFQENHGASFRTWASYRILGAAGDAWRNHRWGSRHNPVSMLYGYDEAIEQSQPTRSLNEALDVQRLCQQLPKREAEVIQYKYFHDESLGAIGARMGLTESRISQLHNMALKHLRDCVY